jgi:hypothetical protein
VSGGPCPALLACLLLIGCGSLGPATVARDQFDYVSSMSDGLKRQTLLNLIKVRYADAPVFLDVASVINAYTLEADLRLGGQAAQPSRGEQFLNLGAGGRYADHPTISYTPLSGERFVRSLLSPLPVSGILFLLQSGYRADAVLRVTVNSVNGLDNAYGSFAGSRAGSEEFHQLLETMRRAQAAGAFDVRLTQAQDRQSMAMFLRPPANAEELEYDRALRRLLKLDPRASEFTVVPGPFAASPREIAIQARSMLQVLTDFASYIEVPPAEVAEGRVYAATRSAEQLRMYPPPVEVRSGAAAPADAYVAVRYRERWFWIDDRNVASKAAFNFLLLMFALTETGAQPSAPILTLPAR